MVNRTIFSAAFGGQVLTAALLLGCAPGREVTPWSRQLSFSSENQSLGSIAIGADGQVAVHGSTFSSSGGGKPAGPLGQNFIASLGDTGALLWNIQTGEQANPGATSGRVAMAPNGDIVIAETFSGSARIGDLTFSAPSGSTSAFLTRMSPSRTPLWSKQLSSREGGGVAVSGLAVTPDGGFVIGGSFFFEVDFGVKKLTAEGGPTGFVAKFDAEGNPVYIAGFRGFGNRVTAVAVDASGAALVTGTNDGALEFGNRTFTSDELVAFALKLDPDGGPRWIAELGGAPRSIAADHAGDVVVAGQIRAFPFTFGNDQISFQGQENAFVAKLSGEGAPLWFRSFGGSSAAVDAQAVVVDADDHVIFTGGYSGAVSFGGGKLADTNGALQAYLAELTEKGGPVESGKVSGSSRPGDNSSGTALALDPAGGIVLGGSFSGVLGSGSGTLNSKGQSDIFLLRRKR